MEVLNDVVLNQVLVRFGDDDAVTRAVVDEVQRDGTCWLGATTWHGVGAMRISFSNWSTTDADVERSAVAILSAFAAGGRRNGGWVGRRVGPSPEVCAEVHAMQGLSAQPCSMG